ncbi:hypothetical protein CBR_g49533 [Chara braunii]|uniref:SHSP domain-containing protein n=1 Tax=Chara braunii TaxID=69332 RepID=A0A388M565_CHABU|nr:hypothetical protein CBR_g49533 [Chara braunii]|eukprot:GBG89680.1 hypothetical protein CBR_g49533 [Chara braunii]
MQAVRACVVASPSALPMTESLAMAGFCRLRPCRLPGADQVSRVMHVVDLNESRSVLRSSPSRVGVCTGARHRSRRGGRERQSRFKDWKHGRGSLCGGDIRTSSRLAWPPCVGSEGVFPERQLFTLRVEAISGLPGGDGLPPTSGAVGGHSGLDTSAAAGLEAKEQEKDKDAKKEEEEKDKAAKREEKDKEKAAKKEDEEKHKAAVKEKKEEEETSSSSSESSDSSEDEEEHETKKSSEKTSDKRRGVAHSDDKKKDNHNHNRAGQANPSSSHSGESGFATGSLSNPGHHSNPGKQSNPGEEFNPGSAAEKNAGIVGMVQSAGEESDRVDVSRTSSVESGGRGGGGTSLVRGDRGGQALGGSSTSLSFPSGGIGRTSITPWMAPTSSLLLLLDWLDDFGRWRGNLFLDPSWMDEDVDIRQTDNAYVAKVDIPGFSKDDVQVRVEDDVLVIEGQHIDDPKDPSEARYCSLNLDLPDDAKPENITADLRYGVLTITVPIDQEIKRNVINIEVKSGGD